LPERPGCCPSQLRDEARIGALRSRSAELGQDVALVDRGGDHVMGG
jgi:hypothetical protein